MFTHWVMGCLVANHYTTKAFLIFFISIWGLGSSVFGYSSNPDRLDGTDTLNQKDSELEIIKPLQKDFVANVFQWEKLLKIGYLADRDDISFELINAPNGMFLSDSARLHWIPPKSAEGKLFEITIKVEKKSKGFEYIKFKVKVAETVSLKRDVTKYTLNVHDPECKSPLGNNIDFNLLFLKPKDAEKVNYDFTYDYRKMGQNKININKINLRRVVSQVKYYTPSNIERLSCFFSMGEIKINPEQDLYPREKNKKNKFTVFLTNQSLDGTGKLLFKYDEDWYRTHTATPRKNTWAVSSPFKLANGLYFIGKKK